MTIGVPSRTRGFTVVELMITIAVAVILLGIAVPSFRELIANQRIKSASFDLFSALNYARSEAIKRNTNVTLSATTGTDWATGWQVAQGANVLRSWSAIPRLSLAQTGGTVGVITYGNDGRATNAPTLEIASTVAGSGIAARCISVDLSGRPATKVGAC